MKVYFLNFLVIYFGIFLKPYICLKTIVIPETAPQSSSARIKNAPSPPLETVSSCLWSSFQFETRGGAWTRRGEHFGYRFIEDGKYMYINKVISRFELPSDFVFIPETWIFFCFSFDNTKKEIKVYWNGEKVLERTIRKHLDEFRIKENFLEKEIFGLSSEFSGKFSDLNVWSRILRDQEIKELYDCGRTSDLPDVLDWSLAQFDLDPNITREDIEEHPCTEKYKQEKNIYVYGPTVSMEPNRKALRICNSLGGELNPPESMNDLKELGMKLSNVTTNCEREYSNYFWVPIFKSLTEDWFDEGNQRHSFSRWRRGQPNGLNHETCAAIAGIGTDGIAYFDTQCSRSYCLYCKISNFQPFYLRGLCKINGIAVDRKFLFRPQNTVNKRPVWKGYSSSLISWSNKTKKWEISNRYTNTVLASLEGEAEFPLGKASWKVESDALCKEKSVDSNLMLMLSRCNKHQFSCSDGSCIPIELKCNFVPNCWDEGDEDNCEILSGENMEDYKSESPDIIFDENNDIIEKNITVSIKITSVESIDEVKSRFTAAFDLKVYWTDPRLTWKDLSEDKYLNFPSQKEKDLLWFPTIMLSNSEKNTEVPNDSKAKWLILLNSSFTMSTDDELHETAYYPGSSNQIEYSRKFNLKFKCIFKLGYFPFDTQTCFIKLEVGSKVRNFIKLIGESVDFVGEKELATFDVDYCSIDSDSDVKVKILFRRQISQYMFGVYLPSLFIMMIAQVDHKRISLYF